MRLPESSELPFYTGGVSLFFVRMLPGLAPPERIGSNPGCPPAFSFTSTSSALGLPRRQEMSLRPPCPSSPNRHFLFFFFLYAPSFCFGARGFCIFLFSSCRVCSNEVALKQGFPPAFSFPDWRRFVFFGTLRWQHFRLPRCTMYNTEFRPLLWHSPRSRECF